ncbi:hypothetical protein [Adhaeribacter soli]|uniref:Uncharacterized protein n=1 Tax=Adhaeribacter soli TaxID=2607655 RepID=A0A5N1J068_9BACT|nr:hypothetical protein [Adhaeribacter soli]KAA9340095.1 hypothetical protein F0P94_07020 [Adhaeribacter soli]
MPKLVELPKASFKRSYDLAKAVDALGGKATHEASGYRMGMSQGGAFRAVISTAEKFNLIDSSRGFLHLTDLYIKIRDAGDEESRISFLRRSFLSLKLFNDLYEKIKGQRLRVPLIEGLLVNEFHVPGESTSRITKYFIDGGKLVKLINEENKLLDLDEIGQRSLFPEIDLQVESQKHLSGAGPKNSEIINYFQQFIKQPKYYSIQITGPEIDTKITIKDKHDLEIITLILDSIRKKI